LAPESGGVTAAPALGQAGLHVRVFEQAVVFREVRCGCRCLLGLTDD